MVWLRSSERFNELAELDVASGRHVVVEREKVGSRAPVKCDGTFALLGDVFCAVYKTGGCLFFRFGDKAFELDENTVVRVFGPPERRSLVVEVHGRAVRQHDYAVSSGNQFPNDPTPFVESEDFDFGLFAANLSQDPERKKVLLGGA